MNDAYAPIRWVIQDRIFGEESDELIRHLTSYSLRGNEPPTENEEVADVYRGSIEFIEMFGSRLLTLDNYRCSKYYEHVPNLLNFHCVWLPWWKLEASLEQLRREFLGDGVFIRPDVGRKIFTGTTLTYRWWKEELRIIRDLPSSRIENSEIVLVASKRNDLRAEYRLVMHRSTILGHVLYSGESDPKDLESMEQLVGRNSYFPDLLYTLDVAFTEGELFVVELNSFVSSGIYAIDFQQLVPKIEAILFGVRDIALSSK
jgi:hypothetical protein